MKDTTIRKIFGKQEKLQGGIGLALSLIQGLTQYDWEAAWPGIQRAMIGLGAAAIAALQGEAIAKGLADLASRIATYQPISTLDNPSLPIPNLLPYEPYSSIDFNDGEASRALASAPSYVKDLYKQFTDFVSTQGGSGEPPRRGGCAVADALIKAMKIVLNEKDASLWSKPFSSAFMFLHQWRRNNCPGAWGL